MRSVFTDVVGNTALCRRLGDDVLRGTLSHAYILEGKKGSGKHMLARRIAAALACEHREGNGAFPCMQCPSCRKILENNSPDVIYVNREDKATLGVDAVREIRRDVWIAPNDISAKIYIIEDAHLMTHQAQNALLLTLEEPPAYVLFLLLCESVEPLLETVRSRAPTLRTEPLSTEQIDAYLTAHVPEGAALKKSNPSDYFEILASADGSIGQARALLDPTVRKPILARRAMAREWIKLCTNRRSSAAALKLIKSMGPRRDEVVEHLNSVLYCLRDLLLIKQTDHAPLCFFADREEAATLAYGFTTPELLKLCDRLDQAIDALRMNANVRLTLTALLVNTGLL